MAQLMAARLLQNRMAGVQRGAYRQPLIASCGLNVGSLKRSSSEELAICHAVEGAPASHGKIVTGHSRMELMQKIKKDISMSAMEMS
jgi:hypothetical protein